MKLAKCEKGHYFDNDKYPRCPLCDPAVSSANTSGIVECTNGHSYNKRIYTHCPLCCISVDNNRKLYVGDFSYEKGEKALYLGVGELGCQLLNGIEKHLNNDRSVFHYYDYNPDTFRYIYSDNCTLLSNPSFLDFSDITDNELFDINELYSNDYLKTILYYSSDDVDTFFRPDIHGLSFLDHCEDIRCLYRNAAAHTDSLTMEEATACCRDIIGTDRNDAAKNVGQVEGLILSLVRISKNPAAI